MHDKLAENQASKTDFHQPCSNIRVPLRAHKLANKGISRRLLRESHKDFKR